MSKSCLNFILCILFCAIHILKEKGNYRANCFYIPRNFKKPAFFIAMYLSNVLFNPRQLEKAYYMGKVHSVCA